MKALLLKILFSALLFFCGCIPYGYETVSKEVIGVRKNAEGKVCEKIVRYDKRLNFIGIIGHDGFFRPGYFCYSRYSAFVRNEEHAITALEYFPELKWTKITESLPVPNSDIWITCEVKIVDAHTVEVIITIFSIEKGKILRHKFENVKRNPPRNKRTLFGFHIEADADLSVLQIHEHNKILRIHTRSGKIIETGE
jgi:hypothetical protein